MSDSEQVHGESFGLKVLEKYGWTEGKGLGANEDGMSDAIKPNLKFDKHGLGHDIVKDIAFNWWDNVFNKALDTVGKSEKEVEVLEEKEKEKKKTYSNFVKKDEVDDDDPEDTSNSGMNTLSTEMVAECEGRTAHKGARHGVYSSGKLERVKKAEREFAEKHSASIQLNSCETKRSSDKRSNSKHSHVKSRTKRRKRTK